MTDGRPANEKQSLALNSAAMAGDLAAAEAALKDGADVHYNRDLPLRSAAKAGHLPMLSFLVRHGGADVHILKDEPLRAAVKAGAENTIETLLRLGADPNAMEGEPLVEAAKRGHARIAKLLLSFKANPHYSNDHALRLAALNGHEDIVRDLARNRADIFAMCGAAPRLAADEGHAQIAEFLNARMDEERRLFLFELALPVDTKDFLRQPYRGTCEPGLIRAIRMDCLPEAVERMKEKGDALTSADLAAIKDREGRPLGFVAADHGCLKSLFDLGLWRGSREDVTKAWQEIPEPLRRTGNMSESDFAGVIAGFNQRALKEKAGKTKIGWTSSAGPR